MNIGIIGFGFVGTALEFAFRDTHNIYINDTFKKGTLPIKEVLEKSEVIFFCLPTPFNEETMHIDLEIYDRVIKEASSLISGKLFVIKSTVIPETTSNYQKLYPNNEFGFNPEFLTEKNANEDFLNSSRIVLGGSTASVDILEKVYRECSHFTETPIIKMSATEAEIVKYQANVILATKVAISNFFYDICQKTGADYDNVRKGVITDPRIGESHTTVTKERGFGGKCFVKDLAAIIGKGNDLNIDTGLVQEVFDYNGRIREDKDWENIPGASSSGKQYGHSDNL